MPTSDISARVGAVVVNFNAGEALVRCVTSLRHGGISDVLVVDNGSTDGSIALLQGSDPSSRVLRSPRNGGYGAGANLGAGELRRELLFICNPDLVVEPDAIVRLTEALDANPCAGVAGPMLLEQDGSVYPSGRTFPGLGAALGHGFVGLFWRGNPWTRRYRLLGDDQYRARGADWVSGAGFLVRRDAFQAVGGFDEAYFMYVEDVDLCWRLRRAGWGARYEPAAQVVHEQGRSTSRHPYRMLVAHHRSILRFASRSAEGRERLLLPFVALALGARLVLTCLERYAGTLRASEQTRTAPRSGRADDGGPSPAPGRKEEGASRG